MPAAGGRGGGASPVALSLSRKLAELLPLCSRLSMAIPALNAGGLIPRKDHDANCIWPAALQLPHGAAIVLDEAVLAPGQLREAGVKGLGALKDLLEMQKVGYDFDYFAVDFPLDASLVAVSTTKSMLPFGCALPLRIVPMAPPPPPETRTPGGAAPRGSTSASSRGASTASARAAPPSRPRRRTTSSRRARRTAR